MASDLETVKVIRGLREDCPTIPIIEGRGTARVIVWPGSGATTRTFHRIDLLDRASTIEMRHESEAAYYVIFGEGDVLDAKSGEKFALREGAMVHIGAGDAYRFVASGAALTILGGPCPADPALYASLSTSA